MVAGGGRRELVRNREQRQGGVERGSLLDSADQPSSAPAGQPGSGRRRRRTRGGVRRRGGPCSRRRPRSRRAAARARIDRHGSTRLALALASSAARPVRAAVSGTFNCDRRGAPHHWYSSSWTTSPPPTTSRRSITPSTRRTTPDGYTKAQRSVGGQLDPDLGRRLVGPATTSESGRILGPGDIKTSWTSRSSSSRSPPDRSTSGRSRRATSATRWHGSPVQIYYDPSARIAGAGLLGRSPRPDSHARRVV
jgi:hypothetical protein